MKTTSNTKTASALFATAVLTSLSGLQAFQLPDVKLTKEKPISAQATTLSVFNVERTFNTANYNSADWGVSATFKAFDNATLPNENTPFSYAVTANGTVRGKAMKVPFTAAEANGLVLAKDDGSATFSGNLKVLGNSIWSLNAKPLQEFNRAGSSGSRPNSGEFVLETSASATFPVMLGPIPLNIKAKVKSSISARFVANVTTAPTSAGPRINLSVGPVASAAATAEASVGAGIDGLASVSAGPYGTLRIGSAGIMGNLSLTPVRRQEGNIGIDLGGTVVLNTKGPSGEVGVFAEAEVIFLGRMRAEQKIAEFRTPAIAPVTLVGPINRSLF